MIRRGSIVPRPKSDQNQSRSTAVSTESGSSPFRLQSQRTQ